MLVESTDAGPFPIDAEARELVDVSAELCTPVVAGGVGL